MGEHYPSANIVPEGKAIRQKSKETTQVSTHIATYQKEWMKKKKEDESFNLSKNIREMLDFLIEQDELDIPDNVLVDKEDAQVESDSGIEVFITKDD